MSRGLGDVYKRQRGLGDVYKRQSEKRLIEMPGNIALRCCVGGSHGSKNILGMATSLSQNLRLSLTTEHYSGKCFGQLKQHSPSHLQNNRCDPGTVFWLKNNRTTRQRFYCVLCCFLLSLVITFFSVDTKF